MELEPDYYSILNLPPDSAFPEVQEQYRRLAKVFHPDRNGGDPWCAEQLKRFIAAYEFLSDPERKAAYDARRRNPGWDKPDFAAAFDEHVRAHDRPSRSEDTWSFTAAGGHGGADSPRSPQAAEPEIGWDILFGPPGTIKPGEAIRPRKMPLLARIGIGIVAAVVFTGAFVVMNVGERGDYIVGRHLIESTAPVAPTVPQPAPAGDFHAGISESDLARAAAEQRAEAAYLHRELGPDWARFERVEPVSIAAVTTGRDDLSAMQRDDSRRAGGAPRPNTARSVLEAKLQSDIEQLDDRITETQDLFDELRYDMAPGQQARSVRAIRRNLDALEQRRDPLFRDIRAADTASAR